MVLTIGHLCWLHTSHWFNPILGFGKRQNSWEGQCHVRRSQAGWKVWKVGKFGKYSHPGKPCCYPLAKDFSPAQASLWWTTNSLRTQVLWLLGGPVRCGLDPNSSLIYLEKSALDKHIFFCNFVLPRKGFCKDDPTQIFAKMCLLSSPGNACYQASSQLRLKPERCARAHFIKCKLYASHHFLLFAGGFFQVTDPQAWSRSIGHNTGPNIEEECVQWASVDQLAAMQVCSCGLEAGLQWTVTRKLTITLIALQLMQKLRSQPIDANKTDVKS